MALADILFIGGAVGQAVSKTVWDMIGNRFLIGWGVGIAACIAPMYIQELSPTRLRGRMVVINVVAITLGQVIAYGIDAGFANVGGGWRWMVGLGTVPSGLQFICLWFLPESREYNISLNCGVFERLISSTARILLKRGNVDEARRVMGKIYAHAISDQVDLKVHSQPLPYPFLPCLHPLMHYIQVKVLQAAVHQSIEISNNTTFFQRCRSMLTDPINRRAVIITCGMQAFQQLCGFNTLMYYSATLFKQIGFNQPTAVGLIVSGTNFLFTLFALKYIDIIGRRKIMLFSAPGMVFGLTLAAIAFYCESLPPYPFFF